MADLSVAGVTVPASTLGAVPGFDVVFTGSEYGIVWPQKTATSTYEIFFRRIGTDGVPKGPALSITAATAGTKLPASGYLRLAWSAANGTYAIVTASDAPATLWFQTIGATGSSPSLARSLPFSPASVDGNPSRAAIAAAPDGTWGVLLRAQGTLYQNVLDASGNAGAAITLSTAVETWTNPAIVHDGTTFSSLWRGKAFAPGMTFGILLHRGTTAGGNVMVEGVGASSTPYDQGLRLLVGPTLTVLWQKQTGTASTTSMRVRRYSLPPDGSAPVAISDTSAPVAGDTIEHGNWLAGAWTDARHVRVVWPDVAYSPVSLRHVELDTQGCP
jgi:hypothetical protein